MKGRYKATREVLYDTLNFDSPPSLERMDAQTIDNLVADKKTVSKEPDGEDELEELLGGAERGLNLMTLRLLTPKRERRK